MHYKNIKKLMMQRSEIDIESGTEQSPVKTYFNETAVMIPYYCMYQIYQSGYSWRTYSCVIGTCLNIRLNFFSLLSRIFGLVLVKVRILVSWILCTIIWTPHVARGPVCKDFQICSHEERQQCFLHFCETNIFKLIRGSSKVILCSNLIQGVPRGDIKPGKSKCHSEDVAFYAY